MGRSTAAPANRSRIFARLMAWRQSLGYPCQQQPNARARQVRRITIMSVYTKV